MRGLSALAEWPMIEVGVFGNGDILLVDGRGLAWLLIIP